MPGQTVAALLDIWRDLERLLDELPADHPEVPGLRSQVDALSRSYRTLTSRAEDTAMAIVASRQTIESTRLLLRRIRASR